MKARLARASWAAAGQAAEAMAVRRAVVARGAAMAAGKVGAGVVVKAQADLAAEAEEGPVQASSAEAEEAVTVQGWVELGAVMAACSHRHTHSSAPLVRYRATDTGSIDRRRRERRKTTSSLCSHAEPTARHSSSAGSSSR